MGTRTDNLRLAPEQCYRRPRRLIMQPRRVNLLIAKSVMPDVKRARALTKLSHAQCELGSFEAALGPAQEAVSLYRPVAGAWPEPFLAELAGALDLSSTIQGKLGRHEMALVGAMEAMDIYRGLAKSRPEKHLPRFAMTLNDVAIHLRNLGRHKEALLLAQGALEWIWPYYEKTSDVGAIPELPERVAAMFSVLVELHQDLGSRLDSIWAQRFEQVAARTAGESQKRAPIKSVAKRKAPGKKRKS